MGEWIKSLIDFFRTNEPFFSGLGNFIAILTAVVATLGAIFGWWRRLYKWLRNRLNGDARHTSDFPFEAISSPDQLMERLLPDPQQRVIPDREIKYIRGRVEGLDTLFEKHGRILIKGRSKTGKTREMAEVISRRWHTGLNVLLLRPNAWLEVPFMLPEELPYRNVVLIINDVDHYSGLDQSLSREREIGSSRDYRTFRQRLQQAIAYFEKLCGASEVRVVATVRSEPEFWDKIEFDIKDPLPPWNSFEIFELEDLPTNLALHLINQLSEVTKIEVENNAKAQIAAKNDGTFLNIILHFRDWRRTGKTFVDTSLINGFEGELAITWQKRYERAVAANPINRYIYAAIDILRRVGLPPHRYLVAELAARLQGSVAAKLSRTIRMRSRRFFDRSGESIVRSKSINRLISRYPQITSLYNWIEQSRFGTAIGRYLLYQTDTLGPKGGSPQVQKALQQLIATEIPIQNDVLMPYDGQVDGRGEGWINTDVVSALLAERASKDEHFVYSLTTLADKLSKARKCQAALRIYDRAIQIAPQNAYAYRERAWTLYVLNRYDEALSDIDEWIHIDPSDYDAYARKALVFQSMEKYDEANELMDQAISMSPAQGWLYSKKGGILADQGMFDEAYKNFDKALSLNPRRHWTYGEKAIALRKQERYPDALDLIDKGIQLKPDQDWLWGQRGITLRLMERYDEALAAFDKAIKLDPKADWFYSQKGTTLQEMERYEEALAELDQAIELDPEDAWAIAHRGITYRLMERYEEALADFDRAIELKEGYTWAIASRGETYRLMERYDDALADFNRATELDPKVDWLHFRRGISLRGMKRYEDALAELDRAIELDPKYTQAMAHRGLTLRLMERYEEALADFDRAIELDPKADWVYAQKGITYRLMEHYEEALADFDQAIELKEDYAWAIAQRGITYWVVERYEEAVSDFDRAIELEPDDARAIASRGRTYRLMQRYKEALADFDRAIQLKGDDVWAIANRGVTYRQMGRYEEALADFERAIELKPDDAWAIARRGQVYQAMERYEEALADFDRAIELNPDYAWAIAWRGETCRLMERYQEALANFDRAIELKPDEAWAIASRGQVYQAMERYEEALADFDRAIALNPDEAWAIAGRGETYRNMERYEEALADFDRAIELDPDDGWYLYNRAITYHALDQIDKAQVDLTLAILRTRETYEQASEDWQNTLDLGLYHLAAEEAEQAERFYREALSSAAPPPRVLEAMHDLEDFLHLFPNHTQAQAMHNMLQKYLQEAEA
jgi:tetratricopeptide (TPR) repeat protein